MTYPLKHRKAQLRIPPKSRQERIERAEKEGLEGEEEEMKEPLLGGLKAYKEGALVSSLRRI